MNPLILVIAGVLLVVGMGLIVLSGVLARRRSLSGVPDSSAFAPGDQRTQKKNQDNTGGSTRPDKED